MTLANERPRLPRQIKHKSVMINAASGWENRNIASTFVFGKPSNWLKTRGPYVSLLPNCPGGDGRMVNILKSV